MHLALQTKDQHGSILASTITSVMLMNEAFENVGFIQPSTTTNPHCCNSGLFTLYLEVNLCQQNTRRFQRFPTMLTKYCTVLASDKDSGAIYLNDCKLMRLKSTLSGMGYVNNLKEINVRFLFS